MEIGQFSTSTSSAQLSANTIFGSASSTTTATAATSSTYFNFSPDELIVPNSYTYYGETAIIALFLILGSTFNGPLLYVYCISNQARSIADKFLINLILADILSLVILLPTIIIDLFLLERNEDTYFRNMTETVASKVGQLSSHLIIGNNSGNHQSSDTNAILGGIVSINPNNDTVQHLFVSQNSTMHYAINSSSLDGTGNSYVELVETWDWICTFKKCLLSGIATASILATLEIAMERYLAIVAPLHYHKFLTKYKVLMTSFGGGFLAIGSSVLSALDPCEPVFPSCTRSTIAYTSTFWWPLYTLGHVTLFFILPVVCMAGIYLKIWLEARRQKAKISLHYKKPFFLQVTTSSPADLKEKPKFFLHPVVLRFKFIDRLVTARMDRAARVAICTMMVTIICWSPYYYVQCAHSIRSILEQMKGHLRVQESWSHAESTLPLLAASLHPVLAPLFYGYRYTIIRDRVFILFHLDRWYPTIRDRRSNSISNHHRSPSRFGGLASVRRKKELAAVASTAMQQSQEQGNIDTVKEQRDSSIENNNMATKAGDESTFVRPTTVTYEDYTVVKIEDDHPNGGAHVEPIESHPFLFTIGAAEGEDDDLGHNLCFHGNSGANRNYLVEVNPKTDLGCGGSYYESSNESNCCSSDALLHHCCNGYVDEDERRTYPINVEYRSKCIEDGDEQCREQLCQTSGRSGCCTIRCYESCRCVPTIAASTTNGCSKSEPTIHSNVNHNFYCTSSSDSSCGSSSSSSTNGLSISSSQQHHLRKNVIIINYRHCWKIWSNLIQSMIQCYSERWDSHRESVSSSSSVVTFLSSRSISSDYLPSTFTDTK